jgi:hypothetical protein
MVGGDIGKVGSRIGLKKFSLVFIFQKFQQSSSLNFVIYSI